MKTPKTKIMKTKVKPKLGYELDKRLFDVFFSAIGLVILFPLFTLIGLIIRLQDGGPVFYFSTRVGRYGKHFKFWKFRTMIPNAENKKHELQKKSGISVRFKMKNDPRITLFGSFLRKYSLDELPQLWNVFIGDMSLVGPRPPTPDEVVKYSPYQAQRLTVPQGITAIWQVRGRSNLDFHKQVELDLEYIDKRSLLFDLQLLLETIPAVITAKGAC